MMPTFTKYTIEPIHEKYAWRICDLMVANSDRMRRYFPKTLEQNLNPDLSRIFVDEKVRQFNRKEEFLFILKEKENHKVIGLVYVKELDWKSGQAELAYCCLLYTSDAADDLLCVDLGGRRIIKK